MSGDIAARLLGENLRAVRNRRGWSLHDVENESGGQWKAVVVGSYERGDRALTVPRLVGLADFYGVPASSLLPRVGVADRDAAKRKAALLDEIADDHRREAARLRGDDPALDAVDESIDQHLSSRLEAGEPL